MISVIFENDDFIIVSKPESEDFHDADEQVGFFNRVKETLALDELYPIHRLDKVTSGLLLMAKTLAACQALNLGFENRTTRKLYLAIATRKPKKKQGLIKGDMERSRRGSWRLLRTSKNPAITRFLSSGLGEGTRAYLLSPKTGKTHQLRVAMKSIGTPILGDSLYAGDAADRAYLHAFALQLTFNNTPYVFSCLPTTGKYFQHLLEHEWLAPLLMPETDFGSHTDLNPEICHKRYLEGLFERLS